MKAGRVLVLLCDIEFRLRARFPKMRNAPVTRR